MRFSLFQFISLLLCFLTSGMVLLVAASTSESRYLTCIPPTQSEYAIYKLEEMGQVSDKDILLICKKFDQLDAGSCGKITLADLVHDHHRDLF
ncbi:two pore potassium channel c-like [Spinacia oleracea]|uniref:Two pore potassium channel c-like n=1 Tax=Spinacia oleracea TaxID=3562 RepID=A0ABM3R4X6_SPIOL|nr:two pore potassium channel c-like [Spinacia oleracea]